MSESRTKTPARRRAKYVAVIFQSRWPSPPALDEDFLARFLRMLSDEVTSDPAETEIDVWLVSAGGCVHVVNRMSLALRSLCCWLRVVIPDAAMSAATLFALGADEIVMGPASVLGPIDVQWEDPNNPDHTLSGLDFANYPNFLTKLANEHIDTDESARFFQPLVGQLEGPLTLRIQNELKVAVQYALAMLEGRTQVAPDNFCPESVANHFVYCYPSHSYAICRSQAAELGLPIVYLETFADRELVRAIYNRWVDSRAVNGAQLSLMTIHEVDGEDPVTEKSMGRRKQSSRRRV